LRRLLIRPGAIGDCVLTLPAMELLRCDYLEVWVAGPNVPLVRFATQVRSIASTGLDLVEIPDREPARELMECLAGFDEIVSWYGTARAEFRAAVAGLPFRFLPALPAEGARMHAADYYLAQVGGRGPAQPRLDCPRWEGGFAVIHPFSGSAKKNWPLARYCELAHAIGARMPVRWCAGPEEPLEGTVRFADLYELACWLAGARLYIGNDSGITHLAAATGAPVVALFGPTDPAVWAPRGPQVRLVTTAEPGGAMESIPLNRVLAAVESV
jgi:ADP-heptose:LPS heptosyltransferase